MSKSKAYQIRFKNNDSTLSLYSDCIVKEEFNVPLLISVVGDDSTVKAFVARVHSARGDKPFEFVAQAVEGARSERLSIHVDRFKSYVSAVGDMTHALLIRREIVEAPMDDDKHAPEYRYLVVPDGKCEEAFTRFMMEQTDTPFLPEWGPIIFNDPERVPPHSGISRTITVFETLGGNPLRIMKVRKDWDLIVAQFIRDGVISLPSTDVDAFFDSETTVSDYLAQNGALFAKKVNAAYVPRHKPGDPVSPLMRELLRTPFPAQEAAIQGIVETLRDRRAAMVVGEMGTGKTLIGAAIPFIHSAGKPYRVIVMAPGHLVKKWKREIEETVPGAKATIIKDWKHLVELHREMPRKPIGREYYVISRDRAKLGYFLRCAARWDTKYNQWHCPDCGAPISYIENKPIGWWTRKRQAIATPAPRDWFDKPKKSNMKCTNCGARLWQANNNRTRRYAPADYIKRKMRGYFDYFIADEVHELKGTSAQGNVLGALASVARRTIALTGTLLGGYAGDLFYILYRLNAGRMKAVENLDYSEVTKWERRYGSVERITTTFDEDYNVSSRGSNKKTQTKKRPGVSPLVFTKHLLDCCAFIELSDIENALPDYTETVVPVDMSAELRAAYRDVASALETKIRDFKEGRRYLGVYLTNLLAYPDQPFEHRPIRSPIDGSTICIPPTLDPWTIYPKEAKLIEIVKKELAEGRRVFIYAVFTGERGIQNRLKHVLKNVEQAKVAVMESKVKPEEREEWIKKTVKGGANVVIANAKLVETGVDLTGEVNFPTLVFYQTGYSLFTLRQASRRSWRIGQTEPVRVYFLAYRDTLQYAAIQLMGAKMEAAMSLEGKFSDEGLRAMAGDLDMTTALAKAITEGIEGLDSAEEIFGRLNAKRKGVTQ